MLCCLVMAIAVWSIGYGMEFFSPTLRLKLWWVKFEYFGNVWLGPLLFSFVLSITKTRLNRYARYFLLLLPPVVFTLLALTNSGHHLMWERAWIHDGGLTPVLLYERSIGFWIYVVYAYSLILIATMVLIGKYIAARGIQKKQLAVITIGIASPWAANFIYLFGFETLKFIDFTPTAFTVSGIAFLWGLLRYQMLSMIPIAHEAIINSMGDPVIVIDEKLRILDMNKAALKMCLLETITPAHNYLHSFLPELSAFILKHPENATLESEVDFSTGHEAGSWDLRIFPVLGRKEKQLGRLLILKDITDKKKAENAAKKSREIQQIILNASPNPIVQYNHRGEVNYLNPAFTRVFGWELDELFGRKIDFIPWEEQEATMAALKRTLENPEGNFDFITRRLTKDGRIVDVSINSTQHRPKDGSPPIMVVNFTDITGIKKTEGELRKTRDYITSVINSLHSTLIGLDAEGLITHWNTRAELVTGVGSKSAIGMPLSEVLPQLIRHIGNLDQVLKSGRVKKMTKQHIVINGSPFLVDIAIYPIVSEETPGAVIRMDDISDRVKIEEMMIQSEKMMSIGGLAAGMAHEINNPLAGIIQNTQVMKNRLTRALPANIEAARECGLDLEHLKIYLEKRKIFKMMDLVVKSGLRAAEIVDNMLSFSRKSDQRRSTHYLHEILESTLELVKNDYNMKKKYDFRNIAIVKEYDQSVPPVVCEKNKIQQVFLNIIKNGAEAMADAASEKPRIVFRCYKEADMVAVEIEDNGPGLDDKIRKRIFEPFFTTKEVGVGTGLGLSVSYFIITENHDGVMTVDAAPGKGACFCIKLPARQTSKSR